MGLILLLLSLSYSIPTLIFLRVLCLRDLQYPTPIPPVDLIFYSAFLFSFLFEYWLRFVTWLFKGSGDINVSRDVSSIPFGSSLVAFPGFHPARSRAGVSGVFLSFFSYFLLCFV